eukprot:TRINITY_DN713_c0_g2_i1.p1 TRINITY_DN713_c0_g2~~TRINITY_DN713_c0_g2_i1.p1  ORF type:complete len:151 (-),score=24.19 TRINITY_DN713_c0_g2_i1:63-461(-)
MRRRGLCLIFGGVQRASTQLLLQRAQFYRTSNLFLYKREEYAGKPHYMKRDHKGYFYDKTGGQPGSIKYEFYQRFKAMDRMAIAFGPDQYPDIDVSDVFKRLWQQGKIHADDEPDPEVPAGKEYDFEDYIKS